MVLKQVTKELDLRKLLNALSANFIQSEDAAFVSLFNRLIYNHNKEYPGDIYKIFTNHACFYVPSIHASTLKRFLTRIF